MANILDSGVKLVRNVGRYNIGASSLEEIIDLLVCVRREAIERNESSQVVFLVDQYFEGDSTLSTRLGYELGDAIDFIPTKNEPTTNDIDQLVASLIQRGFTKPAAIVGMGGGTTMDYSKAISNLLTNGGKAEQYQGWDLVKVPGIFKVGIPTISGTGAEATRTCVMINTVSGLKLGMNSDYTVFDQIIMDPYLTRTVPRNQYFWTGMDAYIHCIESLSGSFRNAIGDSFSRETLNLCRQVFGSSSMMSEQSREQLMVASYLGGCAIATGYVGVVHPFSAGLSVVLGVHHCVANCITMRAMDEFYPDEYNEFWKMVNKQKIEIPKGICNNLTDEQYDQLYASTVIHEKPLTNALGENFNEVLTKEKVIDLFNMM
jgi:3-deoxy-alpha-D-manno-octulosonate 8-oxidase